MCNGCRVKSRSILRDGSKFCSSRRHVLLSHAVAEESSHLVHGSHVERDRRRSCRLSRSPFASSRSHVALPLISRQNRVWRNVTWFCSTKPFSRDEQAGWRDVSCSDELHRLIAARINQSCPYLARHSRCCCSRSLDFNCSLPRSNFPQFSLALIL